MRGSIGTSLAALAIATPANLPCWADGLDRVGPHYEMYAGGYHDGGTSSLNSSVVWSVFGPVDEPGLRLKLGGLGYISGATDAPVFSPNYRAR